MGHRRRFHGAPVSRLIVSVPVEVVEAIDKLPSKYWLHNRSEFVQLAIVEKLQAVQADMQMPTPNAFETRLGKS